MVSIRNKKNGRKKYSVHKRKSSKKYKHKSTKNYKRKSRKKQKRKSRKKQKRKSRNSRSSHILSRTTSSIRDVGDGIFNISEYLDFENKIILYTALISYKQEDEYGKNIYYGLLYDIVKKDLDSQIKKITDITASFDSETYISSLRGNFKTLKLKIIKRLELKTKESGLFYLFRKFITHKSYLMNKHNIDETVFNCEDFYRPPQIPIFGDDYTTWEEFINKLMNYSYYKFDDEKIKTAVKNGISRSYVTTYGPIEYWDTSGVTDMSHLFSSYTVDYDISRWDTSNVTNMSSMFARCSKINSDISRWDVSSVKNMSMMFYGVENFNQDICSWNVSEVEYMSGMFGGCIEFNQDIGKWNTSEVKNMYLMFQSAITFNQYIGDWNVSKVKNMSGMFMNCYKFDKNIGKWNTSEVENMSGMFMFCATFNQDIGKWNTSKVKDMSGMFGECINFNQDIGKWNTSRVKDMSGMFQNAKIFNQNINTVDLSLEDECCFPWFSQNKIEVKEKPDYDEGVEETKGEGVEETKGEGVEEGEGVDETDDVETTCKSWDTSSVQNMSYMFDGALRFDGIISKWDVSKVKNMSNMFKDAFSFNKDISKWDMSEVENISSMFENARRFNQNIGGWNIDYKKKQIGVEKVFWGANSFKKDISEWKLEESSIGQLFDRFSEISPTFKPTTY